MRLFITLFLLVLAPLVQSLDLFLKSYTCNESLPFYAVEFSLQCKDTAKCTFGETATIYGEVVYNNTIEGGIINTTVYATSVLQLMTLEYRLFQGMPLDVCGQSVTQITEDIDGESTEEGAADEDGARRLDDSDGDDADNATAVDDTISDGSVCPENGVYAFMGTYTLPSAEEKTAWLATGWTGTGQVAIYAEEDSTDILLGFCQLKLGTAVTPSAARSFNPPSALVASIATLASVIALFLLCIICSCCMANRRPPRNKAYLDHDPIENDRSHDPETEYQSMSDSKPWSAVGSKASKKSGWA